MHSEVCKHMQDKARHGKARRKLEGVGGRDCEHAYAYTCTLTKKQQNKRFKNTSQFSTAQSSSIAEKLKTSLYVIPPKKSQSLKSYMVFFISLSRTDKLRQSYIDRHKKRLPDVF